MRKLSATLLLGLAVLAGCGGGSSGGSDTDKASASFRGATAQPPYTAPALALSDYRGRRVDLRDYRGKAVLVTFIYTHCPDVCPLIVSSFHTALAGLGPAASRVRFVAVSVDPKGDTPPQVARFLRARQMLGRMDYLIGSRAQLQPVWKRWGILAKADPASPEQVEHSAQIYGIAASGKVTTLYPANFKAAWIVHDAPELAAR